MCKPRWNLCRSYFPCAYDKKITLFCFITEKNQDVRFFFNSEHLKEPLDQFMEQFQKVKIVRAIERQGLIRARLRGYREAVGDVLVFLDSHIECAEGIIVMTCLCVK